MTQPIGNPSHIGNLDASQLGPQPTYLPEDHPELSHPSRGCPGSALGNNRTLFKQERPVRL